MEEQRREDDHRAAAEIGHVLGEVWNERLALWQKALTVLTTIGTTLVGVWVFGTAAGAIKADFGGLPERVSTLETRFQAHLDTTTRPALDVIDENTSSIDTLSVKLDSFRQGTEHDIQDVRSSLRELKELAEANNCWIRVAAQEESRFNCSAYPNGSGAP